jgi:hypothetical protein
MPKQIPRPAAATQGNRDLGDEYLFYDRDRDQVHVLNGTAREIFLLCDGTRSVTEIAEAFSEKYRADAGTARLDAERIIRELADLGVLCVN